jgi:sec-independent protein translocase protein TatA
MFGQLGFGEILLIMVVILLLFGAKRIPEIAGSFGKGIREFKKSMNDVTSSVTSDIPPRDERAGLRSPEPTRAADDESRPEPKRLMQ